MYWWAVSNPLVGWFRGKFIRTWYGMDSNIQGNYLLYTISTNIFQDTVLNESFTHVGC